MSHPLAQQYFGMVLAEREQNLRDDSYFWLTVWNPEEATREHFQYAATAYGGVGPMHPSAVQDALASTYPSVHAALARWNERNERASAVRLIDLGFNTHGTVYKGDRVRVARGRKVPKGAEGRVIGVQEKVTHVSQYGTWTTKELYALIVTESGASWSVAAKHLDVIARGEILQQLFDLSC